MTIEEFASFERRQGERIHQINGIYWRRVRPLFYRPLLPYQEYPPPSVSSPLAAFFGGFQHAVSPHEGTNSFLNLLIFENPKAYCLGDLDRHERREIKRAADDFTVSLVTDVNEFKVQAYRVYLSFYERTKYEYKSERRDAGNFSKWADSLFQNPKVIVLGAYKKNRELGAIGVWHLVEDTLVYSTFFCETESLKMHATGFMLHKVQEAAAGCQAIKQIFIGNYKYTAVKGVDDFYLARGCKLVRKTAFLHINPLTAFFLKRFLPEQYARLRGDAIKDAQGDRDFERATPSQNEKPSICTIPGGDKGSRIEQGHPAAMTAPCSAARLEAAKTIPVAARGQGCCGAASPLQPESLTKIETRPLDLGAS